MTVYRCEKCGYEFEIPDDVKIRYISYIDHEADDHVTDMREVRE